MKSALALVKNLNIGKQQNPLDNAFKNIDFLLIIAL